MSLTAGSSQRVELANMRATSTRLEVDEKEEEDDEEELDWEEQQETGQTRLARPRRQYRHSDEDDDDDETKDDARPSHPPSTRNAPTLPLMPHHDVDDGYDTEDEEERILSTTEFHAARNSSTRRTSRSATSAQPSRGSTPHHSTFSPVPSAFSFPFATRSRTRVLGLSAATCYYLLLLPLLLCFFLVIPFVLVLVFYLDLLEVLISILFALTPPLILYQFLWRRHLTSLHSSNSTSPASSSPLASRPTSDRVWYFFKTVHRTWQQELYQLSLTLLSCVIYILYTYHLHYEADASSPTQYDYVLDFDEPSSTISLDVFIQLEYFLIVSFSIDYLIGFFVAVQKWRYVFNYYALIDLACFTGVAYFSFFHRGFAPVDAYNYYLLQGPLRFMRMRRALKALDRPMETHTSAHVLYRSPFFTFTKHHALLLLVSFRLFLYLMSTAALVLAVEFPCLELAPSSLQHSCNDQLQRFHICVYFVVISISTVGYGDVVCVTDVGRMLMIFVVIGALLQVPAELDAWKAVKEQDKKGEVEESDGYGQTKAVEDRGAVVSEVDKRDAWLKWCEQQLLLHHKQRLPALCKAADVPFSTADQSVRPLLDALMPPPTSSSALLPSPPSQLDLMQGLLEQVAAATRQLQTELHNRSPQRGQPSGSPPAEQTGGVDICFVLDCPSATRNYVQLVRDNLVGVVKSVSYQLAARGGAVRVAFIGNREDGHVAFDLTSEYEELVEQMRPAPLQSDELDMMDDVCDSLKQALDLSWAADSTHIIALLGDRPTRQSQTAIDELRQQLTDSAIHLLNVRVSDALDLLITRWKVLSKGQQQVRQVELEGMDEQHFRIALIANILDIDKRAVHNSASQRLFVPLSPPLAGLRVEPAADESPQRLQLAVSSMDAASAERSAELPLSH